MIAGALLRADLDHTVVFARRLNHLAPFVYSDRDGLLDVNVFARLTGRHAHQRVPVVWRSDDHRINVFAVEDSTKILVGLDAFKPGVIDRKVYLRLEDVADRDNLRVRVLHERLHHAAPLASGADHADANTLIRAQDVRARRSRDADSGDALLDEISAFDSVAHILLYRKSTTKKRRTRRKNQKNLRALLFFVVDFHFVMASTR